MRFGAVFPQLEIGNDPVVIRDFAQAVEALGYGHLCVFDHVLGAHSRHFTTIAPRYTHLDAFHEVFVLLGYVAAATTSIMLMPGVLVLPQRQTALAAKQAATLDVLSGGRLRLGLGVGWNFVEFEALGTNFSNRGRRLDEQVELLRALLAEPLVTFEGDFHRVVDAGIRPLPVQRPLPLWFGGHADAVLMRVAKWGAGWLPSTPLAADADGRATIARLRDLIRSQARDPDEIEITRVYPAGAGKVDTWRRDIAAFRDIGVTEMALDTQRAGYDTVDDHLRAFRQFSELALAFAGGTTNRP